ncbi:MAG: hypothetical protein WBJ81_02285 [Rickettsiales bacterium]
MQTKNKDTTLSIISDPITFSGKRLPNFNEVIVSSASQATFDTFLGRFKIWFGDNPTASAIFRDVSKLPSIYANVYNKNTLGYTDVVYDEGFLWSHAIKVTCKGSILSTHQFSYFTQGVEFETVARGANYICEVPNRYLNIATREKQRFEKSNPEKAAKSYWRFLLEDSDNAWWAEATGESLVKTTTSDQLGEVVKKLGYIEWIRDVACGIDNTIAIFLGGNIPFEPKDDIYSKAVKSFTMFGWDYRTPIVLGLTTTVDWSAKFITETINAYSLGTPTRAGQDFTGAVIRDVKEIVSNSTMLNEYFNEIAALNPFHDTSLATPSANLDVEL